MNLLRMPNTRVMRFLKMSGSHISSRLHNSSCIRIALQLFPTRLLATMRTTEHDKNFNLVKLLGFLVGSWFFSLSCKTAQHGSDENTISSIEVREMLLWFKTYLLVAPPFDFSHRYLYPPPIIMYSCAGWYPQLHGVPLSSHTHTSAALGRQGPCSFFCWLCRYCNISTVE